MKIVKITWVDSAGDDGNWEHKDGMKPLEPLVMVSVGFLLENKKAYKTICQSDGETQVMFRLSIVAKCIQKIETL